MKLNRLSTDANYTKSNTLSFPFSKALTISALCLPTLATADTFVQDFSGFHNQFQNGNWGMVDLTPNNTVLSHDNPETYTQNGRLLFAAHLTSASLNQILGNTQYQYLSQAVGDNELRRLINEQCETRLEIGIASRKGAVFSDSDYSAALRADLSYCVSNKRISVGGELYALNFNANQTPVLLRTFIPTIPGAKYNVSFDYQRASGNQNVIVKVNGKITSGTANGSAHKVLVNEPRIDFPVNGYDGYAPKVNGMNKASAVFVANRTYTPVVISGGNHSDASQLLVQNVKVAKLADNPNTDMCNLFFPAGSPQFNQCMSGNPSHMPSNWGCDMYIDDAVGNFTVNKPGQRVDEAWRYEPRNIFHQKRFYAVGKGGVSSFRMTKSGQFSFCPIYGKTLSMEEFTSNNWDYERYPEQGLIKVRLYCLDENTQTRYTQWEFLETGEDNNYLLTNRKVSKTFNDDQYKNCALDIIRFFDKTHLIPPTQSGYAPNSDGYEIRNLKLQ